MLSRAADFVQVGDKLVHAFVGEFFLKQLAIHDDGVEGRAKLVAHVGQEFALGDIRRRRLRATSPRLVPWRV